DRANALSVTVNNVAPTIAISGATSVNEGSAYSLTLGAVTDPGTDTVSSYIVHWGDGGSNTYLTNGVKTHTYADGPNNYSITVDLVDEDGTYLDRANALSVTVNNVAPTVVAPADQSSNEGTSKSFDLGSFSDPGVNDNPWAVDVSWGDASAHTTFTMGTQGTITAQSHTSADGPNDYTVTVKLTDKDGDSDSKTFSVHVNNVAPTATFTASSPIDEGSSSTLSFTGASDPSAADTIAGFHYSFAC